MNLRKYENINTIVSEALNEAFRMGEYCGCDIQTHEIKRIYKDFKELVKETIEKLDTLKK
jgi:hypothetical protein